MSSRIYVASSWRNYAQPAVVHLLRHEGFDVYDFRNPSEVIVDDDGRPSYGPPKKNEGFSWREIDPGWRNWTHEEYLDALESSEAEEGFRHDYDAMMAADIGVVVLPCGASAHLEAGFFDGHPDKHLVIVLPPEWDDEEATQFLRAKGHSMNSTTACPACGDIDGCWLMASEQRRMDALKWNRFEPELMYKMADAIVSTPAEVGPAIRLIEAHKAARAKADS